MKLRYWGYSSPNKEEDADDAATSLKQINLDQNTDLRFFDGEIATIPSVQLAPKKLNLRPTTYIIRKAVYAELLVIIVIIGLCILAAQLNEFVPDTSWSGVNDTDSCDLWTNQRSNFQNAFTINLRGSTHLTFTQAKAIDVTWQLLGGAGGRFLMAWISYKVFMDGLTRLIEQPPISYKVFLSLTFSTTSLYAVWNAFKAGFTSQGWRTKAFLSWFIISTIYVLGFPTLLGAAAGYLTPSTAGFRMTDGTFLQPDSPDLRSCFQVFGGALIGHSNGSVALGPPVFVLNAN